MTGAPGPNARCRVRARQTPAPHASLGPLGRGDRHGLTRSWRRQGGTAWLLLGHLSAGAGMTEQQPYEVVDRPDGPARSAVREAGGAARERVHRGHWIFSASVTGSPVSSRAPAALAISGVAPAPARASGARRASAVSCA